jgi:serine/threonine-protein kinase HipA
MHLKNFSLIRRNGKVNISPAYYLLNTTIALPNATEEIGLPIGEKKKNLTRNLLIEYFGKDRLKLTEPAIREVLSKISAAIPVWEKFIRRSFLSEAMQVKYYDLISGRRNILGV